MDALCNAKVMIKSAVIRSLYQSCPFGRNRFTPCSQRRVANKANVSELLPKDELRTRENRSRRRGNFRACPFRRPGRPLIWPPPTPPPPLPRAGPADAVPPLRPPPDRCPAVNPAGIRRPVARRCAAPLPFPLPRLPASLLISRSPIRFIALSLTPSGGPSS